MAFNTELFHVLELMLKSVISQFIYITLKTNWSWYKQKRNITSVSGYLLKFKNVTVVRAIENKWWRISFLGLKWLQAFVFSCFLYVYFILLTCCVYVIMSSQARNYYTITAVVRIFRYSGSCLPHWELYECLWGQNWVSELSLLKSASVFFGIFFSTSEM